MQAVISTVCEACVAASLNSDEYPATPCHECLAGRYWHSFAQGRSECIPCAAGRADLDMDSTTECEDCSVGEYAGLGSSACTSCASIWAVRTIVIPPHRAVIRTSACRFVLLAIKMTTVMSSRRVWHAPRGHMLSAECSLGLGAWHVLRNWRR